MTKKVIRNFVG